MGTEGEELVWGQCTYALQAWEACNGSQGKHTKSMHRAAYSTGFDICSYTHTPDKSQRYYPIQVYLWDTPPQSIDKSVLYSIMVTAGKHGIQSMQG